MFEYPYLDTNITKMQFVKVHYSGIENLSNKFELNAHPENIFSRKVGRK